MSQGLSDLIDKLDTSNMLDLILQFPNQVRNALEIGKTAKIYRPDSSIRNVLIVGMGGSAIGGNLLRDLLTASGTLPCEVVRDYALPNWADSKTLVALCSYSGNTEETLSAHQSAISRGCPSIICTSGGKLEDRARENGHPVIRIPGGQPPRSALGYLFFPFLQTFLDWNWIKPEFLDLHELFSMLEEVSSENNPNNSEKTQAIDIAEFCLNRIPVIYSSPQLQTVALRWKGQICENSKSLAYHNVIPEMNHNEVMGWQRVKEMKLNEEIAVIFLRDKDDHLRTKKRMDITKELIGQTDTPTLDLNTRGNSLLARIFSLIYLGDFVSYNLALRNSQDPTAIKNIEYLKSVLAAESA